jgi:patatin-like phospholipase/acyl hydrolase
MRHNKITPRVSNIGRTIAVFMSMLAATTAYADCPNPKDIYRLKDGGHVLCTLVANDPTLKTIQWVSSNYCQNQDAKEPTLVRVEIASLESEQHGLACVYEARTESGGSFEFKMYESIYSKMLWRIKLANEKEWDSYFINKVNDKETKFGYMCETSSTKQCAWSYVRQ